MDIKSKYFILLYFFVIAAFSQSKPVDTSSIRTFPDKITTRLSLINTSNSFFINDTENNINYNLTPNRREYLGLSVLFRSVELDLGYSPSFINQNKDNKDSRLFNLNLRMFVGQWMQTFDVYSQKGFSADLEGVDVALPNIETLKVGGSTSYIFNPNFSFRAIGFQNEWQKKSAGSFIPHLYYYHTTFKIKSDTQSENATSLDIAIAPAYYYNFVFKKYFIFGLGTSIGMGYNQNNLGDKRINSALLEFSGRAVLGYNSDTLFAGVNSSINAFKHKSDRYVRIDDSIVFLEFYIGYRFKAPKSFIKMAKKVNKALGL